MVRISDLVIAVTRRDHPCPKSGPKPIAFLVYSSCFEEDNVTSNDDTRIFILSSLLRTLIEE